MFNVNDSRKDPQEFSLEEISDSIIMYINHFHKTSVIRAFQNTEYTCGENMKICV